MDSITLERKISTLEDAVRRLQVDGPSDIFTKAFFFSGGEASGGGDYTLPIASAATLGGIKVGTNLSIDGSGVLSATYFYNLPMASAVTLGGIKVGTGLSIDGNGVLSATSGGGNISGSISANQLAVGSGTNTIGGSSALTWDGSLLSVAGKASITSGVYVEGSYSTEVCAEYRASSSVLLSRLFSAYGTTYYQPQGGQSWYMYFPNGTPYAAIQYTTPGSGGGISIAAGGHSFSSNRFDVANYGTDAYLGWVRPYDYRYNIALHNDGGISLGYGGTAPSSPGTGIVQVAGRLSVAGITRINASNDTPVSMNTTYDGVSAFTLNNTNSGTSAMSAALFSNNAGLISYLGLTSSNYTGMASTTYFYTNGLGYSFYTFNANAVNKWYTGNGVLRMVQNTVGLRLGDGNSAVNYALEVSGSSWANTARGDQVSQTIQTSSTSTGAITWTLSSGAAMYLSAALTGGVTLNLSAPVAGSVSELRFIQGGTAQTLTLSMSNVVFRQTNGTGTGTSTYSVTGISTVNAYYSVRLFWATTTLCYVTVG